MQRKPIPVNELFIGGLDTAEFTTPDADFDVRGAVVVLGANVAVVADAVAVDLTGIGGAGAIVAAVRPAIGIRIAAAATGDQLACSRSANPGRWAVVIGHAFGGRRFIVIVLILILILVLILVLVRTGIRLVVVAVLILIGSGIGAVVVGVPVSGSRLACQLIVRLYDAWGKPDRADPYRIP